MIRIERLDPTADGVQATVVVPAGCPWFDGHFPARPLLPAVAHLAIVLQAVQASYGGRWTLIAVKALRLRRPILPDEPIELSVVVAGAPANSRFELRCGGGVASHGVATLRRER